MVLATVLFVLAGCRERTPEADVRGTSAERADVRPAAVAWVGEEAITAEEFRLSYAFGPGALRRGDDPRRRYLGYLVAERAMALEAERRGLDTAAAFRHAMRTLEEELLIERVFEEEVLKKIEVPEADVRRAIERDAVRFRFRFLPALSERAAWRLRERVVARGYEAVLASERDGLVEAGMPLDELASPLLGAGDLDPDLLAAIEDLALHAPSEPVERDGLWFVFEVTDVRRQPLAEADYEARAPTFRKTLYNRQAMEAGAAFVARTMEPLNVVTKRPAFERLNQALWAWYREATPQRNLLHELEEQGRETPYAGALRAHYDDVLVRFGEEAWTIRTFLDHFTPGRYVLRADDEERFKARLADVVALVVRDAVFLRKARTERLDRDAAYQQTLAQWRAKGLYEVLKGQPDVRGRLAAYADSLVAAYGVAVNDALLDTLDVQDAPPHLTVQLFKSNANKPPFPTADPAWSTLGRPPLTATNPNTPQ